MGRHPLLIDNLDALIHDLSLLIDTPAVLISNWLLTAGLSINPPMLSIIRTALSINLRMLSITKTDLSINSGILSIIRRVVH